MKTYIDSSKSLFFKIVTDDLVDVSLIKMAAHEKPVEMPKKFKKR